MSKRFECSPVACSLRILFLAASVLCFALSGQNNLSAQTSTWTSDGDGNWTDATNWNNGEPNGVTFDAIIDDGDSAVTVTLDQMRSIGNLTIGGDDALDLTGGDSLLLSGGEFLNDGTFTINSNGANADSQLVAVNSLAIRGTGEIVLNNLFGASVQQRASIDSLAGATITQEAGHTISGNGRITAALTNEGTVRSDTVLLQLIDNAKTNTGTFEATNSATLQISGIDVANSGGQIVAEDASTVALRNNARVIGGTFDTNGSGSILVDSGSAFLQDVTNQGTFGVTAGDNVQLENSFTNNGTVTVNSDGLNADTQLVAANSLTIDGTGEIVLNNRFGSTVPQRASIDSAIGSSAYPGSQSYGPRKWSNHRSID